jgi:hypothetical protein
LTDLEIVEFLNQIKGQYKDARLPYEAAWRQARSAYYGDEKLTTIYKGNANIRIPVIDWKVNGTAARINRVLLNQIPIARFEARKDTEPLKLNIVDLWNEYVFKYQLKAIEFTKHFKQFIKDKLILGTSIGKITQEFEVEEFSYFDEGEEEPVVTKDNTFFKSILLEEFYTDITKETLHESRANVHSTVLSMDDIFRKKELYENINLLVPTGNSLSVEQEEYLQRFNLSINSRNEFTEAIQQTQKTGYVPIDEYYVKMDLDNSGIAKESLVIIAMGMVVLSKGESPFRHKRYKRPFILGKHMPVQGMVYGESKVIKGLNLLYELNACRAQSLDSKTRSIAHMWWENTGNGPTNWDKVWTPNGVVSGNSPEPAIVPILNPYLGHITMQDSTLIERDIDKLWNLSPIQEGSATRQQTPETFKGTAALISQNDMPLNDIIQATAGEMAEFLEVLYERNLRFKTVGDLAEIVGQDKVDAAGIKDDTTMRELQLDLGVRILGNMELSNEGAMQRGWELFITWASQIPNIARRLKWKEVAVKKLQSFGIKDDSEDIWIPEKDVQKALEEEKKQQQQAQQEAIELEMAKYKAEKTIDTDLKIVEMGAEARIEKTTKQKVS